MSRRPLCIIMKMLIKVSKQHTFNGVAKERFCHVFIKACIEVLKN